nr:PAS domain-containing sensor histidine kinase [Pseudomarimonas arenosa]
MLCVAGADGRFKRINPAFMETLGYSERELLSRPFIDFVHPEDVAATLDEVKRLNAGELTIDFENRYRCADGSWKWMSWRARADQQGDLYAVARDETERHRIELIKRELISTVSHELRTPLTSLSASLDLIGNGVVGDLAPPMEKLVTIARQNARRLLHLVNDLLDLDRISAGKLKYQWQVVELSTLLGTALEANASYAQCYQVKFEVLERCAPILLKVDPQRLLQVLSNLLSNAAKFSPQGGVVQIRTALHAGTARIEVIDQGPGIPEEFRPRVFERFAQADSSDERMRGGSGLGLAISREITEGMAGQIGFQSSDKGATFYLEFPAQCPDEPPSLVRND